MLAAFSTSIPDKVWIDAASLNLGESMVQGGTYSNQQVGAFIEGLNESTYFKNAAFSRTEASELNNRAIINFELTFDLVRS